LTAAAAAGCSERDEGAAAQDSTAIRPCALVEKAEVETAVGIRVGDGSVPIGVPSLLVGEQVCQFRTVDAQGPPALVKVGAASAYAPVIFNRYKAQQQQATPVPDVGEQALWDDVGKVLVVLDEDHAVTVTIFGAEVNEPRERATRLAKKALGRL
jgi:hypothetical protein